MPVVVANHKHEWAVWGDVTWQRCTGCGVGRFTHQHVKLLDEEIARLRTVAEAARGMLCGLHERECHNPHDAMWRHFREELTTALLACGMVPDGAGGSSPGTKQDA